MNRTEPIRLLRDRYKVPPERAGHKMRWMHDTNYGTLDTKEFSDALNITRPVLQARFKARQWDDPEIVRVADEVEKSDYVVEEPRTFNTKRCRRNNRICKDYSACQSARLKLLDAPKWVEPEDTDHCYEAEAEPARLGAISGLCNLMMPAR